MNLIGKNGLYEIYPKRYVQELKQSGRRDMAMAFLDFWDDYKNGERQSKRFYAKAWKLKSDNTAWRWMQEFKGVIETFESAWSIHDKQQHRSAKKSIAHLSPTDSPSEHQTNTYEQTNHGNTEDHLSPTDSPKTKTSLDVDVVRMHSDKDFRELFFVYGVNGGRTGEKVAAFREYISVVSEFDIRDVIRAITFYLNDQSHRGKTYNCANFLKNNAFIPYMQKRVEVLVDGAWISGVIDDKTDRFISDKEHNGKLIGAEIDRAKMVKLFGEGRLKFITETKR